MAAGSVGLEKNATVGERRDLCMREEAGKERKRGRRGNDSCNALSSNDDDDAEQEKPFVRSQTRSSPLARMTD